MLTEVSTPTTYFPELNIQKTYERPALRLTENCVKVLKQRYLKKNEKQECIEEPIDLFERVARVVASAEGKYGASKERIIEVAHEFLTLMAEGVFMPNSPTLMNAGREMGMLSACFVLPIGDSISDIFDTVKNTAMIQKAGGGTGFTIDRLRSTGDFIKSSGGTTSGPISFWKVLSEATNAIQQGAFRRGANMMMATITLPDILKFIYAKQDLSRFQNYNISVKVTDAWMTEYKKNPNQVHIVINPRTQKSYILPKSLNIEQYQLADLVPFEAYNPEEWKEGSVWTMKDIWDVIVNNAWATGEPGVIFIDRINDANPTPNVGEMEATNPCGEQPLLPYEACNLGSINLGIFVRSSAEKEGCYDWDGLRKAIRTSTRFLENVVEVNNYVIPEIEKVCKSNRKIGLGIMGFADALFKLGVGYNTYDGLKWGEDFMKFVNDESHNESEKLAEERGCFANWEGSRWQTTWKRKQRNACCTTVAPTGTISIIANCSGGIEPLFSLAFQREVMRDHTGKPVIMSEVNDEFKKVAKHNKFWGHNEQELYDRVLKEGTLHNVQDIPEEIKRVFVCAHDIAPDWHVRMQAAFQKHCDSSISKTTNFPNTATPEDVRTIYTLAFDTGCKGITVYRDGCRKGQPMTLKKEEKQEVVKDKLKPVKTPQILSAIRIRQNTPFGHVHLTVTVDPKTGNEMEVFAQLGRAGDIASADLEAICRMASLYLRSNGKLTDIVEQLEGIGSSLSIPTKDGRVMSLGDGVAKALARYLRVKQEHGLKAMLLGEIDVESVPVKDEDNPTLKQADVQATSFKLKCPECHVGQLAFVEGCKKCASCGYSAC